jgi:hypothetical protein
MRHLNAMLQLDIVHMLCACFPMLYITVFPLAIFEGQCYKVTSTYMLLVSFDYTGKELDP